MRPTLCQMALKSIVYFHEYKSGEYYYHLHHCLGLDKYGLPVYRVYEFRMTDEENFGKELKLEEKAIMYLPQLRNAQRYGELKDLGLVGVKK